MWKKYGETEKAYAARNIITNKMPDGGDNANIKLEGVYYMDANGNFDIYKDNPKNYTNFESYETDENGVGVLKWYWSNTNTDDGVTRGGVDSFVLDKDNFYYTITNEDGSKEKVYGAIEIKNSYDIIRQIEVVLNRLPKTFKKSQTASKTLYADSKVTMRLKNLTSSTTSNNVSNNSDISKNSLINKNALQESLVKANKIAARSAHDVKAVKNATLNQIEPKIQAAYGFTDFGRVFDLNVDGYLSMDDGSYVTTHKIGYEDCDRYRTGEMSCDSFLFLSPLNHSEIQVNGDANNSSISIKSNESLRVPVLYQYRMEDYNGSIFGHIGYKSTDAIVKNTKYANIIGIDIWLNSLGDTPKQYDIVVYSTYNKDDSRAIGTISSKLQ